ncbi:MAG: energy-coupling factor transporter transmembrane protein EcfT [Coriobacteriia bacterium]|nr:energy-coupling factor transporter transmembrane protein EcfT [Coriobacteriia bacterium]
MKRLLRDARTKMALVTLLTTGAVVIAQLGALALILLLSLVAAGAYGASLPRMLRRWRAILWLLGVVALFQIAFLRTGRALLTLAGVMLVSSDGLRVAGQVSVRYLIIMAAALIMSTSSARDVTQALTRLRLPTTFVFMVIVTVQFIPRFAQLFRDSLAAMQLRGLDFRRISLIKRARAYLYLIFPVIAAALIAAQDLAIAMETRGFGAYKKRSAR